MMHCLLFGSSRYDIRSGNTEKKSEQCNYISYTALERFFN